MLGLTFMVMLFTFPNAYKAGLVLRARGELPSIPKSCSGRACVTSHDKLQRAPADGAPRGARGARGSLSNLFESVRTVVNPMHARRGPAATAPQEL